MRVFTIGETVMDIIFKNGKAISSTPGGSMLNSAISLSRLGCPTFFISETGNDICGRNIKTFLQKNGVDTSFFFLSNSCKTTISLAFLDEHNEAQYDFYRSCESPINFDLYPKFTESDWLLFGSFYAIDTVKRKRLTSLLQAAHEAGTKIFYDPNIRIAHCPLTKQEMDWVLENISFADIVRGSDDDFKNLFQSKSIEYIYQKVFNQGCRHLFITKGAKGSIYKNNEVTISVSSHPIIPISLVGAGDTFNAGIVFGILNLLEKGDSLIDILQTSVSDIMENASRLAAQVCLSMDNYVAAEK